MKIKSSQNGEIILSFTDIGKSCHSREFETSQICLLTLLAKIKFSRKFPYLQYKGLIHFTNPQKGAVTGTHWRCSRFCFPLTVLCDPLEAPMNGAVTDDRRCGSSALYSCNSGYQLSGSDTRYCLKSGNWSDEAPTCLGKCDITS